MSDDETAPADVPATTSVTRTVDLEAGADAVWEAIADPELRATWLDDDDAARRTMRVDEVDEVDEVDDETGEVGEDRRLVWTWWRPDGDDPGASTVEIAVSPLVGGGTRVVVTETPLWASAPVQASATASMGRWDFRLLGLELLFVAAGACVL
jgi:uncharacterized protein YndB with AHSA1/START domain